MGVDYGDYFGTEDPDEMMDIIENECRMAASYTGDPDYKRKRWMKEIAPMVNSIAKHSNKKVTYAILPMSCMAFRWHQCAEREIPLSYDKIHEMKSYNHNLFCMVVIPHKDKHVITYNILEDGRDNWYYEYKKSNVYFYPIDSISCKEVYVKPIFCPQNLPIKDIWKRFKAYKEWHHSYIYHDTTMGLSSVSQYDKTYRASICNIGDTFFLYYWTPYRESKEYQDAKRAEEEEEQRVKSLEKCEPDEAIDFDEDEDEYEEYEDGAEEYAEDKNEDDGKSKEKDDKYYEDDVIPF